MNSQENVWSSRYLYKVKLMDKDVTLINYITFIYRVYSSFTLSRDGYLLKSENSTAWVYIPKSEQSFS